MNKQELQVLVEKLINIRDRVSMSWQDKDVIADACNVIYHNIDKLSEDNV